MHLSVTVGLVCFSVAGLNIESRASVLPVQTMVKVSQFHHSQRLTLLFTVISLDRITVAQCYPYLHND